MSVREDYPEGVPCWVDTAQPDPVAAAGFYSSLFGWEAEDSMPSGSGGHYLMARLRGYEVAAISSLPPGVPYATWSTYIRVSSADETVQRVQDAGGSVVTEPMDIFEAGRMAVLADPEGAVFSVWQPGQHRGATLVNEPGTFGFNDLRTDDVEAAQAFYGAVFGWEVVDIGGPLWARPGYGDHLETLTPGLHAGLEQMGVDTRFADVVAQIFPRDGGPARWGVTFFVEDAAAAARRVQELGGALTVAPHDVPWMRVAEAADPAGAAFTLSQFVPENQ